MTKFKVLPWLRALRDRHAKELAGLNTEEILRVSQERSAPLMREFLKAHPNARRTVDRPACRVAESRAKYGKK